MKNFYWNTIGTGKINIIILNGWGMNFKIWFFILKNLNFFFKFHLIDLPGYGLNKHLPSMNIDEIVETLYNNNIPRNAIWIGWSIGGLIASRFALSYPEHTLALISVTSSPCFIEKESWPGITKNTAYRFYIDLKTKYQETINNFLNLQINLNKYLKNLIFLKKILLSEPNPGLNVLQNGLKMICSVDLRLDITFIKVPFLRIYGSLDSLVPKQIVKILDKKWPNTSSIIIEKAAHAPFISHQKEFCSILLNFKNSF